MRTESESLKLEIAERSMELYRLLERHMDLQGVPLKDRYPWEGEIHGWNMRIEAVEKGHLAPLFSNLTFGIMSVTLLPETMREIVPAAVTP